MKISEKYIQIIGILGGLAVILGAFGAHALKDQLSTAQLAAYKTGVLYHFIHTLLLFGIYIKIEQTGSHILLKRAFWFVVVGIICFSGSLYLLTTQDLLGINLSFLGPITPIGGIFFIIGWVSLIFVKNR